ncbi:hypothetical protein DL98DRAFT_59481 [Cadophora sp. DSE1049]|nr:hypothetical protein DL98DRAFT_59481 [Cadophora sp. DSE1049]
MATTRIPSLETLPLLVLERICQYLEDESPKQRALLAFSLTSKSCRAAAETQWFSQIEIRVRDPNELQTTLRRWNDILAGELHRHVRRLKISWKLTEEEKSELLRGGEDFDEDLEEDDISRSGWNVRPYFHMHTFLRPSKESLGRGRGTLAEHPENWAHLGQFVNQFSGLRDLVWAAGQRIPPSVLSAISERGCRLHHHNFSLPSLIQTRDDPQPISPADYELCTSASLFSIVAHVGSFESGGKLNYVGEAVMRMVSGLAPKLAHLCDVSHGPPGELEVTQAIMLGKPDWQGFFPGKSEMEPKAGTDGSRNRFQSLVFTGYVPQGIQHWSQLTDLSNLRCLDMPWELRNGSALADIAARGDMPALQRLRLCSADNYDDDETEEAQSAMNLLLSSLNPLQRLEITGYISPRTFDILVDRHGANLRYLTLKPSRDERYGSRNPLPVFSAPILQHFAKHCPQLTNLSIPINRIRGDKHEVGIYRALSRLPSLQHLSLELMYSVGPDEEFWDEEKDGEYPLSHEFTEGDADRIPLVYLQETFSNGMDEALAREIFSLISGSSSNSTARNANNKLRYLRL